MSKRDVKKRYNINLKLLFDGYSKNYSRMLDDKFLWSNIETLSWSSHSIKNYFKKLGESLGFNVAMEKMKISNTTLSGAADILWIKNNDLILHLECENAKKLTDITEEIIKMSESYAPYKVGIFIFLNNDLGYKIIEKVATFFERNKILKEFDEWLIIYDFWSPFDQKILANTYSDSKGNLIENEVKYYYYPLIGKVFDKNNYEIKINEIYNLPLNKIGFQEGDWESENTLKM